MEFRIMTYNIYGARLADGKKLAKSIKKYKPDFVALQEVDKNTKRIIVQQNNLYFIVFLILKIFFSKTLLQHINLYK